MVEMNSESELIRNIAEWRDILIEASMNDMGVPMEEYTTVYRLGLVTDLDIDFESTKEAALVRAKWLDESGKGGNDGLEGGTHVSHTEKWFSELTMIGG